MNYDYEKDCRDWESKNKNKSWKPRMALPRWMR